MKRLSLFGCLTILALFVAVPGHASLTVVGSDGNGNQLIYDSGLNITWYDYDPGNMTWSQATAWAAGLNVGGVTGWRLPQTLPVNGSTYNYNGIAIYNGASYNGSALGSTDIGYNISAPGSVYAGSKGSEMAYLFYNSLGNKSPYDTSGNLQSGWGLVNTGLFTNLYPTIDCIHWSGTEYAPVPGDAWRFTFYMGTQDYDTEDGDYSALAVHPGNVGAPVPIPGTILLFAPGLLGLLVVRRRFKK